MNIKLYDTYGLKFGNYFSGWVDEYITSHILSPVKDSVLIFVGSQVIDELEFEY